MRLLAGLAALVLAAPAQAVAPARLQVVAKEFSLALSRQTIKAGPADIELVNYGMDPHDLRLQRVGGAHIYGMKEVPPGKTGELHIAKLRPGRYRVWCSIAHHREDGMRATLRVVARS